MSRARQRDENRYRAEHPGRKRRVTKNQLQRWTILALLVVFLLGLLTAGAAEGASLPIESRTSEEFTHGFIHSTRNHSRFATPKHMSADP